MHSENMAVAPAKNERAERYQMSVAEYKSFREQGFLVVRGLVSPQEIEELRVHTEELMQGRLPEQSKAMNERDVKKDAATTGQSLEAPPAHLSPIEKAQYFVRIHMLHRQLELHERFMLHPRVLDVLEVLIGPGRFGDANDAVFEAARQTRSGLASGFVLHSHPSRQLMRSLDRD